MTNDICNVLMVYPRFTANSFWSMQETCELMGIKYPSVPLGLITVAAMLPSSWQIRLIDCNTRDLVKADIDWADLVMTGGMLFQQFDTLRIIDECHANGKPVVVGGPDVTSSPGHYESADFRVLGEAEGIIKSFIEAWRSGARSGVFESPKFQVDVTTSPIPRFDLLNFNNYFNVGVQFSRGCPFNCEFCDIIELYGHMPRAKTGEQMLAELQSLYELGYRGYVDFVDDNLIGNKKALKAFLPDLIEWQKERGYPFEFSTEASINLSDDPQLLAMMREAPFAYVFVGIESPDPDVLTAAQKKQNTRRDISESIHKIYDAGIFVIAGFIVGFDDEKGSVAEPVIQLIEDSAIPICMVGLLYALPNTQLTRRLEKEGRLHSGHDVQPAVSERGDQCTAGLNFDTKRPRQEVLADYMEILDRIYTSQSYFGRVRRACESLNQSKTILVPNFSRIRINLRIFWRLAWGTLNFTPEIRKHFWSTLAWCCLRNPWSVKPALLMFATYVHIGPFSRYVCGKIAGQIEEIESGNRPYPIDGSVDQRIAANAEF